MFLFVFSHKVSLYRRTKTGIADFKVTVEEVDTLKLDFTAEASRL